MIVALVLVSFADAKPRRSEAHVAPPMAEPAPVEAPPTGPAPVPPAGWDSGVCNGEALAGAPSEAWAKMLDGPALGAVATDGQRLVVTTAEEVLGYDLDGRSLWKQPLQATGPAVMAADGAWVGTKDGRMTLLDAATGAVVRTVGDPGPAVLGHAVPEGKHVAWVSRGGTLWHSGGWSSEVGEVAAGLGIDSGTAYVATRNGVVSGVGRDGLRWSTALDGPVAYGPVLDASREYVAMADVAGNPGGVCAVGRDGVQAWCYRSDFGPAAPLTVGEGLVLLPDKDGNLYALHAADGRLAWSVEGFGAFTGRAAWVGGTVYAGNGDGTLYAVDPDDGGVVWSMALGAPITTAPTIAGGLLVVPLGNGRLVALAVPQ